MASKISICNVALSRLGASNITSLTDNTTESKLCLTFYDLASDEVMMSGPWSSTIRRKSLALLEETPVYEYDYMFQLPTNPVYLKILDINSNNPDDVPYAIENGKLLINYSSVNLRYVARIADTEAYGPFLTQAIISKLTAELSYPLVGKATMTDMLLRKYEEDRLNLLALDGQQGSSQLIYSQYFTNEVR